MGNWHCVLSDCAEVNYRPYESSKIRYQYPNEQPQFVDGDNYTIENETGKCFGLYQAYGTCVSTLNNPDSQSTIKCGNAYQWYTDPVASDRIPGKILSHQFMLGSDGSQALFRFTSQLQSGQTVLSTRSIYGQVYDHINKINKQVLVFQRLNCRTARTIVIEGASFTLSGYRRLDSQTDNCGDYIFTVYKNNQKVFEQKRNVAPAVEKIACQLKSNPQQIAIKKDPLLERVEVVPYAYDVRWSLLIDSNKFGFLLVKSKIPDHCLNIYKNSSASTIPTDFGNINNTPENLYNLIAQICSAPNCPPPEYQVLCDSCGNSADQCESCPGDTCPIECHGKICCYNDYGISVKEIALDNYCGG